MKKYLSLLAVLGLLLACQGKENPSGGDDNGGGNKEVFATAISLSKSELTLEKGANEVLTVSFTPENTTNKTVTWVSSNTGIATVTDGVVVAVGPGSTEIIAKCGNASAKCAVTVVVYAQSISLNKSSLEFNALNQTETLIASVTPSNTTDLIEWSSSDESVASVVDGLVTAIAVGETIITAKCGGVAATCSVKVRIGATSISLSETRISLKLGKATKITATLQPSNTTDEVEWSSSDPSVATVQRSDYESGIGFVTAIEFGTVKITAKAGDVTAGCDVTVDFTLPTGAVDMGLSVKWASCNLGASRPEQAGDYYAWGETETKSDYSWSTYKWADRDSYTGYGSPNFIKYNTLSSYGVVDNRIVLETGPEGDDVASKKLGGNWRMPSSNDWDNLARNCYMHIMTVNGVNGLLITSGTTGNSIFFPVHSYRDGTTLKSGSSGYWFSDVMQASPNCAYSVSMNPEWYRSRPADRYIGLYVRPVTN